MCGYCKRKLSTKYKKIDGTALIKIDYPIMNIMNIEEYKKSSNDTFSNRI